MASNTPSPISPSDFHEIIKLMWGNKVKDEVFQRWKQGFKFSVDEPTALVQNEGGPCAVLAPVQAYILKSLISANTNNWRQVEDKMVTKMLINALCEILGQAGCSKKFILVQLGEPIATAAAFTDPPATDTTSPPASPAPPPGLEHLYFHSKLKTLAFDSCEEVQAYYSEKIHMLQETFGVLLFLYSVMCTKGIEALMNEVSDPEEPLIDAEFGYGSQSLINLMITGRAVGHVWNYDQDVGGLKLKGIEKQSTVGFLTLLEHLRYCEVGSFLKNPVEPVWVLASETHLTVLFSFEKRLVRPETPSEVARRVFKSFDPDGNNFIQSDTLQQVLQRLQLVSEPEYVDIMKKKLDCENLGIILLPAFMDEFFPEDAPSLPDTFNLFHYNGLTRSCHNRKVVYQEGQAVLLESHVSATLESDCVLTCLQTKWSSIDVTWLSGVTPSLN